MSASWGGTQTADDGPYSSQRLSATHGDPSYSRGVATSQRYGDLGPQPTLYDRIAGAKSAPVYGDAYGTQTPAYYDRGAGSQPTLFDGIFGTGTGSANAHGDEYYAGGARSQRTLSEKVQDLFRSRLEPRQRDYAPVMNQGALFSREGQREPSAGDGLGNLWCVVLALACFIAFVLYLSLAVNLDFLWLLLLPLLVVGYRFGNSWLERIPLAQMKDGANAALARGDLEGRQQAADILGRMRQRVQTAIQGIWLSAVAAVTLVLLICIVLFAVSGEVLFSASLGDISATLSQQEGGPLFDWTECEHLNQIPISKAWLSKTHITNAHTISVLLMPALAMSTPAEHWVVFAQAADSLAVVDYNHWGGGFSSMAHSSAHVRCSNVDSGFGIVEAATTATPSELGRWWNPLALARWTVELMDLNPVTMSQLREHAQQWSSTNAIYSIHQSNCQHFAKYLIHFLSGHPHFYGAYNIDLFKSQILDDFTFFIMYVLPWFFNIGIAVVIFVIIAIAAVATYHLRDDARQLAVMVAELQLPTGIPMAQSLAELHLDDSVFSPLLCGLSTTRFPRWASRGREGEASNVRVACCIVGSVFFVILLVTFMAVAAHFFFEMEYEKDDYLPQATPAPAVAHLPQNPGGVPCVYRQEEGCLPYDCNVKTDHWRQEWSVEQDQWCCDHAGVGCER